MNAGNQESVTVGGTTKKHRLGPNCFGQRPNSFQSESGAASAFPQRDSGDCQRPFRDPVTR
eukprot:3571410-Alexandrium_andersonii.AAC.1